MGEGRVTDLGPRRAAPTSREVAIFQAPGLLVATRQPDGRWPVFEGGRIFEFWMSAIAPSNHDATITLSRYKVAAPAVPNLVGIFTFPAGSYVHPVPLNFAVERGEQLAAVFSPADAFSPLTDTPVRGLVGIARIS